MPTQKDNDQLILLPMPLSPNQVLVKAAKLKELLRAFTFEELVERQLKTIYNWDKIQHRPTKRLFRNYTLAYSAYELKVKLELALKQVLIKDSLTPK